MKAIIFRFVSAAMLTLSVSHSAYAGDLVVIAHSSVSLSANEVRDVFLGEKQFAGSTKLVPVDNAAQQENFLSKLMQMPSTKYNSIWTKKAFRDGLTAPAIKSSDREVIEYVKRTPGAVSYVSSSPGEVNIIK
jgi:ABC-type phosphate transport system substrate-binding protein